MQSHYITIKVRLPLESCCRVCYIIDIKRKAIEAATLNNVNCYVLTAVTTANSGGYFLFPLKIVKHNPIRATMNIQN